MTSFEPSFSRSVAAHHIVVAMTVGIPASGKSTICSKIVAGFPDGAVALLDYDVVRERVLDELQANEKTSPKFTTVKPFSSSGQADLSADLSIHAWRQGRIQCEKELRYVISTNTPTTTQ